MNPKLEKLFDNADAEFWLQLDDGLSERWFEELREYCENISDTDIKFVLEDYKRWKISRER